MAKKLAERKMQEPVELEPEFSYEDRHEFVERMAYKLWEERGRPSGSPDVDWVAAEQALYSSMVASGLVAPSATDQQHLREKIYR